MSSFSHLSASTLLYGWLRGCRESACPCVSVRVWPKLTTQVVYLACSAAMRLPQLLYLRSHYGIRASVVYSSSLLLWSKPIGLMGVTIRYDWRYLACGKKLTDWQLLFYNTEPKKFRKIIRRKTKTKTTFLRRSPWRKAEESVSV